ncbi:MAG TPA: hypothetical protein VEE85_02255, partial [Candidatus Bathyarchaeia archaeon]|nr:hypothetical protein [Candidatus Bathyarchaeia archaeon]
RKRVSRNWASAPVGGFAEAKALACHTLFGTAPLPSAPTTGAPGTPLKPCPDTKRIYKIGISVSKVAQ